MCCPPLLDCTANPVVLQIIVSPQCYVESCCTLCIPQCYADSCCTLCILTNTQCTHCSIQRSPISERHCFWEDSQGLPACPVKSNV